MTGQAMARARSLTEFQRAFPDEASCAAFLFERRWPGGFVCPVCGKDRAAALKSRAYTYECSDCGRQTSITAGTALHRTKLPLTVWFWAAHLMSTHSNGMSARQLEDQLGLTYRTAWLLTQKLRRSIPARERRHVTEILAELMGWKCYPFGPLEEAFMAASGDGPGTMIEVYPEQATLDIPNDEDQGRGRDRFHGR